jgi:DNA polymerase-4
MAVCGDPDSRHGIILAKNELAKAAGVQTAETIWKARQKCPDLHLVLPHHEEYAEYSKKVNAIYARYTDMVEPFGIDESWLDVTGSLRLFGSGEEIANRLRKEVKEELGLTISVGVSFNKVFAKLGSDYKKPDATTVITRENMRNIVYPLPVETLLFVGGSVRKGLEKMAVRTIGDLAAADPHTLRSTFGKVGEMLSLYARGEDNDPVRRWDDQPEAKSVGKGLTFTHDLTDFDEVKTAIRMLSDAVAMRLRKNDQYCTTVQLAVKTSGFHTVSRQQGVVATCVSKDIADVAIKLFCGMALGETPVRTITVTATGLTHEETAVQTSLFDEPRENGGYQKRRQLENAMDGIRDRYGKGSIGMGSLIQNDFVPGNRNAKKPERDKKIEK